MTPKNSKTLLVVLSAVVVILSALYAKGHWDYVLLSVRLAFAEDQIRIFDDMRIKASQSDANGSVGCLEYVLNYYPSGTKQIRGSQLDRIVETARANAVARILSDLRHKTGNDFGDDPQRWIDHK